MISKRDLQLGKIALRAGMVTKEQLAKSLAIQKKLEKPVGLGAIFIKKGYITKEQLEEIVKLHNDKNGVTAEKPKKKKKKKKGKKDAAASESESKPSEAASESAPSSEEAKPAAEKKALKTESEIDPGLLESAPSDAGPVDAEDPDRRLVGCEKCGKKYRVKKKQAGKRFACRKCKAKVRIPKDIFDDPPGKTSARSSSTSAKTKSAANPAMKVEEFSLGSSDDAAGAKAEAAPDAKKTTGRQKKDSGSAKKPAPAAAAPKKELSIAELAKAATEKKAAPLGPRLSAGQRLFGYVQALVFLGVFAGIVGGIWYWRQSIKWEREEALKKARETEWEQVSAPFQEAADSSKKVLEKARAALAPGAASPPTLALVRELTTAGGALEKSLAGLRPSEGSDQVLQSQENKEKAKALIASSDPDELVKSVYLARGRVLLSLGGESNVLEAARGFAEIVFKDPRCHEGLALLGQAELKRRNYPAAIEALKRAVAAKDEPRAHALLGCALEAGDLCRDAVKEYDAAKEPLAAALKARALLAEGDADAACSAVEGAKLEGEAASAAQVWRGQALEKKGDLEGAARAFQAAVEADGKSGRAHVARGEFRLRCGQFAAAAEDFDAALKTSGGARAAAGLGDAKTGLLDTQGARTSYVQAVSLPVVTSGALLFCELDAFDDLHAPDPRAAAARKAGDAALAAGHTDEARGFYLQAVGLDPFDPESHAAVAQVEIALKNVSGAEPRMKQARALLASAHDHDPKSDPVPVRGARAARTLLVEAAYWDAKGDLDKAVKAIDAALAADAQAAGATAYALKGAVLLRKGSADAARNEYRRALDLETGGKDAVSRFYAEALAAYGKGDAASVRKASAALDAALTIAPRNAHALWLRGRVALLEKKYDDALARLNDAVAANAYFTEAYVARGFYYLRDLPRDLRKAGVGDSSFADFDRAVQLEPTAEALYGRALAQFTQNHFQEALQDLNDAIRTDGRFAPAYKLRSDVHRQIPKHEKEADADAKKYQELSKK